MGRDAKDATFAWLHVLPMFSFCSLKRSMTVAITMPSLPIPMLASDVRHVPQCVPMRASKFTV